MVKVVVAILVVMMNGKVVMGCGSGKGGEDSGGGCEHA